MINKIKEAMQVKEQIKDIKEDINSINKIIETSVNRLKNGIEALNTELNDIKKNQREFLNTFKEDLEVIKSIRKDFQEEMYEFKLLKGQMQKNIIEKFEEELRKELNIKIDELKKDNEVYENLKKGIGEANNKLNNLSEEINKFVVISSRIKEKDFEMEKFAKELLELDSEKLQLMKKIDTLERLIAKMRRTR